MFEIDKGFHYLVPAGIEAEDRVKDRNLAVAMKTASDSNRRNRNGARDVGSSLGFDSAEYDGIRASLLEQRRFRIQRDFS